MVGRSVVLDGCGQISHIGKLAYASGPFANAGTSYAGPSATTSEFILRSSLVIRHMCMYPGSDGSVSIHAFHGDEHLPAHVGEGEGSRGALPVPAGRRR